MSFVGDIIDWFIAHPGLVISLILLYVFITVLSVFFSSPKPGKNPFKIDCARTPKPLVKDHAVRDRILKQGECEWDHFYC